MATFKLAMWIALVAALATAVTNATGALLQEGEARRESQEEALKPRLLVALFKDRRWLLGLFFVVLTFGLHGVALAFAPLVFVQPIVLLRMPFAVPFAAKRHHHRLGVREWIALALATVGLALFIVVANPRGGIVMPKFTPWLWTGVAMAGAVAVCTVAARGKASPRRAGMLGTAAGLLFAGQAVLMRTATEVLRHHGFVGMLTSWSLWTLVAVAILAMLYQQSAYQAGAFAASRPPLDVAQLLASVLAGLLVFQEVIRKTPLALAGEVIGIGAALLGVVMLARSPVSQKEAAQQRQQQGRPAGAHA